MVKKLLKHEIANSYKYFTPVFIIGIVGALVVTYLGLTTFQSETNLSDSQSIIAAFAVLLLFGLGVVATVLTIGGLLKITYKSLYSVTGYRQFTYPITSRQRIIVKTITALFWNVVILAFLVLLIGASITIVGIFNGVTFQIFIDAFVNVIRHSLTFNSAKDALLFTTNALIGGVMEILIILFVGAFANTSFIRKKRSLVAIIAYIVIAWVINIVKSVVVYNIFGPSSSISFLTMLLQANVNVVYEQSMMITMLLNLIFCVLAYVGTEWLWDHKLEVLN